MNPADIVIGALVAAVVLLVLIRMRKNRKAGKSSCGCGCSGCPSSGQCHKK